MKAHYQLHGFTPGDFPLLLVLENVKGEQRASIVGDFMKERLGLLGTPDTVLEAYYLVVDWKEKR